MTKEKELYANFRGAKVIQVLKIEVNEGEGKSDDPIVRVAYLTTFKGRVLAKFAGGDEIIDLS